MRFTDIFQVGDEVVCACGSCAPIKLTTVRKDYITGVDKDGYDAMYTLEDMPSLRKATKLDKALK